ncbi:hypothetical protein FYK55_03605 [Roseiconus nitratireducens]|uniref:Uncharacterized protein n=1 Tax=Roseiconus nitratireducens TaxID=2605748 RepID=A0A5M6DKZ0_9BACT|nr:hypothetical protein [Roseiconus nitratireducens]KAA5546005.1 hypothetical protein FYK55_03605 [Roseiconus nitratireducens]
MATRFVLNPPIDADEFDRRYSIPQHIEHRIVRSDNEAVVDAITIDTDGEGEILAVEQELRYAFEHCTPTIERSVPLDAQ